MLLSPEQNQVLEESFEELFEWHGETVNFLIAFTINLAASFIYSC